MKGHVEATLTVVDVLDLVHPRSGGSPQPQNTKLTDTLSAMGDAQLLHDQRSR